VHVEAVVSIASVYGPVVDRYEIPVRIKPGDQSVHRVREVSRRQVVQDLADDDQVVTAVRQFRGKAEPLNTHIRPAAQRRPGGANRRVREVEGQQAITAGRKHSGQLADGTTWLKTASITLAGKRGDRDGVLATLIPG
jgi:hypothetical protein